ncbi:hypothetical protein WME98_41020 [Sorangium sp. So ce296]|uniref:hypothetical protein n=1 Tax=Sorangium sp. So ce296 TaxID=3133296 RepID=UPI003F621B3C
MTIPTTQCSVQIQIWVDTNAIQNGSTRGVYLVDNRVTSGGQNEGSANLVTSCTQDSYVCWQILTVDPNASASVQIQSIGSSNAWGPSGQPQVASDNPNAFTGQAQNPGSSSYQLSINVTAGGGSGTTVILNPGMNVQAISRRTAA